MRYFEILAILGAMAWLPSLINFFKNILIRPVIKIISNREIQIGYTTFGPILNINIAISAKRKETLVEKMEIIITHESKETHYFTWNWHQENLFEMSLPGLVMPYTKNQPATALKILTTELVEKRIGFCENKFKEEYQKLTTLTSEVHSNILQANKEKNDIKGFREYNDLIDLLKNSFFWKIGKYTVKLLVYTVDNRNPFEHDFKFQLINLNIKSLVSHHNNNDGYRRFSFILASAVVKCQSTLAPIALRCNSH